MSFAPRISVVIPTKRLTAESRARIERLRLQTYPNFDVYVVTDEPESFPADGLDVRFLASGPVFPNQKRLQAARASDAAIVALIDDDAYAIPEWLARAAPHFADPGVIAAGGPGVTPPEDGPEQQISGAIFASPLVSAAQARRYVPLRACEVDLQPTCNLLIRREDFIVAAERTLSIWPGEDAMLCMELRRGGKRIVYDPAVLVYHHRRALFGGHFRQVWNYAVARGHFIKAFPEMSRDPAYLVPLLFAAGNVALAVAPAAPAPVRRAAGVAAAGYLALVAWEAARAQRTNAVDPLKTALGIYLTHLTYGAGVAYGLAGLLRRPA